MRSDGQSRGSMTYSATNSLSSGNHSSPGRPNQTTASAPTHTAICPAGEDSHQLPPRTEHHQSLMEPSPLSQSVQQPAIGALRRTHSSQSSSLSRGYPEPSSRILLPVTAPQRRRIYPTSPNHTAELPPLLQQTSPTFQSPMDPSTSFSVGNYNRSGHLSQVGVNSIHTTATTVNHPAHPLSTSFPLAHPIQLHRDDTTTGYGSGYSVGPLNISYSSPPSTTYLQEGFQVSATPGPSFLSPNVPFHPPHPQPPAETGLPYPPPDTLSFSAPTTSSTLIGAVNEPATAGVVNLNIGNWSSVSATLTTTLNMNVSVTTGRQMAMDTTRIRPSSIPMSNGNPLPSTITPSAPESSTSWSQHPPHPAQSTSASMSISAPGNAFVELKAHVTCGAPALPHSQSAPGALQNHQAQGHSEPQLPVTRQTPFKKKLSKIAPPSATQELDLGTTKKEIEDKTDPQAPSPKRRRKGKMHECAVCGKEFPRPSGLLTHMNTHNNAKPYPCTYLGCKRMFGVRSNAKRHLRTHGVSPNPLPRPTPSALSTASTSTRSSTSVTKRTARSQPYVVGFEPVILGEPLPVIANKGKAPARENGNGNRSNVETSGADSNRANAEGLAATLSHPSPPFFKLRWMPLSSTSRTNAAALRKTGQRDVQDGGNENDKVLRR